MRYGRMRRSVCGPAFGRIVLRDNCRCQRRYFVGEAHCTPWVWGLTATQDRVRARKCVCVNGELPTLQAAAGVCWLIVVLCRKQNAIRFICDSPVYQSRELIDTLITKKNDWQKNDWPNIPQWPTESLLFLPVAVQVSSTCITVSCGH